MAPPRKSKSVNKQFSHFDEASPSKDVDNRKKSLLRKRKNSDMLGSQWTKEELEHFYDAYRKHGKDWKKVAIAVRNRSVEMVEALYMMNRAYLSLPEGTASVVGLIAMMTDYYCNMGGRDGEQESSDGEETSWKPQKRSRGKLHPCLSKRTEGHTIPHLQSSATISDCLSFLNKARPNGIGPRAVGKRTPRYHVSYPDEQISGELFSSTTSNGLKLKEDATDDDVAHEVALVLAEASQRGGSPQVSRTPKRGKYNIMSSPVGNGKRMHIGTKAKSEVDEEGLDGSTEAENGDPRNVRRSLKTKIEANYSGNDDLDDVKEACSGTEGQNLSSFWGKLELPAVEAKTGRFSFNMPKKRSKKVLFGEDEGSPFDALQALADLATEEGLAVQLKDGDDLADKPPEILSSDRQKDSSKSLRVKTKRKKLMQEYESSRPKTSRFGKGPVPEVGSILELNQKVSQSIANVSGKRQKAMTSKTPADKVAIDGYPHESQESEAWNMGKKFMRNGKWSSNNSLLQKHGKLVKHPKHPSSSTEQKGEKEGSSVLSMQANMRSPVNTASKVRSRRKAELKEPQKLHLNYSNELSNDQSNLSTISWHTGAHNIQETFSNCMSSRQLRRWCAFEWFYSAVDYPWFAKKEFVEYLNHVGLGHIPRLTRVEWGVIRSSLGKPRRFSEQFLREEKDKLNKYRDSVRTHYTELRSGKREGLPTDLARPLSVGQRVVAIHPQTREIHDGSILTVDHTKSRVQFGRPELGVEFVMDIGCMPQNPLENMPACMANSAVPVDKTFENFNELTATVWLKDRKLESLMKFSSENPKNGGGSHMSPSSYTAINLKPVKGTPVNVNVEAKTASNGQQVPNDLQIQVKEADAQALANLTRALDKKEALVSELRHMNDDITESRSTGDNDLEDSELFKKQYAAVIVQLNEINEQVSSSLFFLKQRNVYQGNSILAWPQSASNLADSCLSLNLYDHPVNPVQDSASHVKDIVESSREKARTMVDTAVQAMFSMNQWDNIPERIEETIDYVSSKLPLDDSGLLAIPPSTIPLDTTTTTTTTTSAAMDSSNEDKSKRNMEDNNESQIPSELISHCVANLFMIQKCTERHFPPTDVAQILDSAVTSLQPCCSQNLPVYMEIQKCMGIIRNQILALIPT